MLRRFRSKVTYANVISSVALFFALTTGGAYAAIQITGANIVNGTVTGADIKNGSLASTDVKNYTLTAADLASNSVTGTKVRDFSLTPADSGILFSQVNDDGSVTRASSGVTVTRLATGIYEVDFGRVVVNGTFIATPVKQDSGVTPNAIVSLADRAGNTSAIWVEMRDSTGADIDCPFHLVVIL